MSIETVRLSEKARQQLIQLKRKTGITQWNILCRWALCLSLAEPSRPPEENVPADSSLEISWKVFGGTYSDVYMALIRQRAINDGIRLDAGSELTFLRLHLHRGISYLTTATISDIGGLIGLAVKRLGSDR